MSLASQINDDIKTAMRAKDKATLRALRAVKSAILLTKTAEGGGDLDETGEIKLLSKLVKQRKDSITIYEQQGRADLAEKEVEEVQVIEKYLPQQLSDEELEAKIQAIVTEVGATSMRDMGKVMGKANKTLAGQADGKRIATMVKKTLK